MAKRLIDINSPYIKEVLPILLKDRTTNKNIIWAASGYPYSENDEITIEALLSLGKDDFQPRVYKSALLQKSRTKSKAEVFTPSWLCNEMNNYCDDDWFGKKGVFNIQSEDNKSWERTTGKIVFPNVKHKTWQDYILVRKIEITCGEAPYVISRYDTTTGDFITIPNRIGFLDRKLRVIYENAKTYEEWLYWTYRAFQQSYGYEWQGDSLLIARINLLLTFAEYKVRKWKQEPTIEELTNIATIVSWNFWQMDGLTYQTIWNSKLEKEMVKNRKKELEDSIREIQNCDFTESALFDDIAIIAQYSGDIPKGEYEIEALEKMLRDTGYLPPLIESFARKLPYTKIKKPKSIKELAKRQQAILKRLNKELEAVNNHKFNEQKDCVIHKWQPSLNRVMDARNITFKNLIGDVK